MGLDRGTLDQLRHLLRPLVTRISNVVARGTVQLTNDAKKLQLIQLGALAGETIDNAEYHQPYGFSSVPLAGAEVVVVFPNGDRSHPIVLSASDRRYRITSSQPGEVTVYNNTGAKLTITKDGDIIGQPAAGRNLLVTDGTGSPEPVVKRSEFLGHGHATAGTGAPSCPITVTPPASSATFPGTTVFQSK